MLIPEAVVYRGENFPVTKNTQAFEGDHFRGKYIRYSAGGIGRRDLMIAVIKNKILVIPASPDHDAEYILPAPFPTFDGALAHIALLDSVAA
jgi:hypothetical protein